MTYVPGAAENLLALMFNDVIEAQNNLDRLRASGASDLHLSSAERAAADVWERYKGAVHFWHDLAAVMREDGV